MKYGTGEEVQLGDIVSLNDDRGGVVVCVFDAGAYSAEFPESQWSYLKKGVLVRFPKHGLIHYQDVVEPEVLLVTRSAG